MLLVPLYTPSWGHKNNRVCCCELPALECALKMYPKNIIEAEGILASNITGLLIFHLLLSHHQNKKINIMILQHILQWRATFRKGKLKKNVFQLSLPKCCSSMQNMLQCDTCKIEVNSNVCSAPNSIWLKGFVHAHESVSELQCGHYITVKPLI